ncbi:MAG: NosD domain-containing protein, partial [Candidatus Thorarchaeota archaeon]
NDNDRYWLNGIGYGIYLRESSNNILINNTANSNAYYRQDYGIYLESSSNNNLTDNSLKNNNLYDIFVWVDSDAHCNNIIENTIGTGDWPIKYFNYSATLQDEILSELILCNADNSYIDNITVTVSGDKKNNGILILRTENSNLSNIKSLRNRGFYLYNSSSNTLINNNLTLNNYGFYFSHSSNNTLTNNTANSNRYGGVYFSFSSSNTLTNNTVNSNNNAGIYLHEGSNNNTLTKNIVSLNDYGIYLESSSNNDLIDNTVILNYDNGILLISSTGNSLTNNVVDSNDWGIRLIFSSSNTLTNNTANSNRYGGIYLEDSSDETPSFDVGAGESSESGNTYYVSTNGNDTNLGTEDYPWRTITYAAIQAQAGDTVYIKSGDYGDEHVVISNSGTKGNPIVFQGYKDIPGDIPGSDEMPLINGTLKYGGGSTILIEGKKYITIRNIKVNRNDRGIFMKEGSEHLTLDNIIVTNADAEGIALEKSRYSNIRNCNVTDSGMTNIVIRESNYNVIENCSSYEVTTTPGAATDYHIGISEGHDNILRNCMAVNTRPGHAVLAGHAIGIKDTFSYHTQEYTETHSYNNKIIDCMSYNTGSEVWVSHGAHHNEFINYNIVCDQGACGSFVVRDGAYSNKFTNCRGSRAILVDGTEGMLGQIQKDNIFVNCIFDGQGITFNRAENNTIKNCVITNAAYFYYLRNENKDNIITNCIVNNVDFYINTVSGASGEPTITYTDFYNNGFDTPVGTGNIEVNPLFVDPENGDYHLKSEYGRWDGLSWVYDAETSPCIDAGNPTDDYCYEPQSNGGRINMGAYGNTDEASKSSSSGECEDLIYTASNNNISSNEFINNTQYGAYLHGSGYNIFWLNNFTDNGFNAYEEPVSLSNDWNITDTGNYWDDFTSNPGYPDNYTIPGPGDGIDYHPLNEICYLPWDVTGDGYVGIDDIVSVAEHFGESPGHPDWDPVYDVNDDDYVGIDDIVEVAEHFGESC